MHIPVLLHETIDGLKIQPDDVVLDGTVNGGGHSSVIAQKLMTTGTIVGMDRDADALTRARKTLEGVAPRVLLVNDDFRNLDLALTQNGFEKADKILLDLGLSSDQLEDSGRGFSFQKDEPLLMTFKAHPVESDLTAKDIVNTWEEESLANIIYGFGEETFSRRIAKAIVERREERPIETSKELAEVIKKSVPRWYAHKKTHCATKTFQALRIATNDELGSLKDGLTKGFDRLNPEGRMAVITFHSIEDRIVKNFFKERAQEGSGKILTKKPLVPGRTEVLKNKRARSAKLRIIGKL